MDGWTDIWMDVEIEKEGTRRVGSRGGGHSKQPNLAKHLVAIDLETNERTSERANERAASPSIRSNSHGSVAQPSANACPVNCLAFNYHE